MSCWFSRCSSCRLSRRCWEPSRGRLSGLRPPAGFWSTLALIYPSVFHHLPNVQCYFENVQRLIAAVEGELNDYLFPCISPPTRSIIPHCRFRGEGCTRGLFFS